MKRRLVVVLACALLLISTVGAFAFEQSSKTYPWMASFNKTGQLNLYAAVGLYAYGVDLTAGVEVILGNFDLAGIPLEWGIEARGLIGFAGFSGYGSWIDWGAAPMLTLHWGTDFGKGLKFEVYGGLGLGLYGTGGSYYSSFSGYGPFFGFAGGGGVAWHFSNNFSLILDSAYVGWTGVLGIGIKVDI
jgi:hypothetical protein